MKAAFPPLDNTNSKLAKKINRLTKLIVSHQESLILRKIHSHQCSVFFKKMIEDGRLTKQELKENIISKRVNRENLLS